MVRVVETLADCISKASQAALKSRDKDVVSAALAELSKTDQIVAAAVYAADGTLVGNYLKPGSGESIPDKPSRIQDSFEDDYLVIFRPIVTAAGGRLGTAYLKADVANQLRGRTNRHLNTFAMVLLVSFLVAFLISYKLQPLISQPILELANTAKAVTEKKDYLVRARKTSDDEVGALIEAFNEMLAVIQQRDAELQHANDMLEVYNENLEKKVEERTADLVRATAEAQEPRTTADEANRTKSAFLANMSHELRTPLNAIIGYSEMLQEDARDMGQDRFVADLLKIHSAGNHLLGLINDVLDISKVEAGKMDIFLETIDVAAMIEDVVSTIK